MRTKRDVHAALLGAACLMAVTLAAPTGATASPSGRAAATPAAGAERGLIPVWAFVNGSYPVADARVTIVARGRRVRQLDRRAAPRTNANGVALVSVRRVPRRFTVVVTGGRVAGVRLRGSLRSVIESGHAHAAVVEVNPLTTLIRQLRQMRPRLGVGQATRAVKRHFDVPQWADLGQNLRAGPDWFSAPRYARAARRHGSIDRLNRSVARGILRERRRCGRRCPGVGSSAGAAAAIAARPVATQAASERTRFIERVFGALASGTLAMGTQTLIGGALGGLLELAKLGGVPIPDSEFEQTQRQLERISAQLTQLQGQVAELEKTIARSHASQLLHQSDPYTASIDHAVAQLEFVANADPDDPTLPRLSETISDYIGRRLLDAPAYFNRFLNSDLADNPIKATSHAVAVSRRFFGPGESAQVAAVYEYFATYQLQLAVLLTNYWNTRPDTYNVDYRRSSVRRIERNVEASESSLRPAVPDNTVIDTDTKLMWTTNFPTGPGAPRQIVNLRTIAEIFTPSRTPRYRLLPAAGPTRVATFPFDDWRIPSLATFERLVQGRSGSSIDWLVREGGFDRAFLSRYEGRKWISDRPAVTTVLIVNTTQVDQFSFEYNKRFRDGTIAWVGLAWTGEFDRFLAGLMFQRPVPADERYWW